MKIFENITKLIGKTPLVELKRRPEGGRVVAKLEYFNPSGSVKDRAAFAMLDNAVKSELIDNQTIIIEPTSGNTGVGLAMCCAHMGLELILTMPENMSFERRKLLKAYGANLVLTPEKLGMQGAVDKANELLSQNSNAFMPSQFENPNNPLIHEITTAEEIWNDTDGRVDIVIAGIGTGGTITGVSRGLKKLNSKIKTYGVEPLESPLITQGKASPHKIQGIGANFIPKNLDLIIIDGVFDVSQNDAADVTRKLAQKSGIFCGISSGAVVKAALDQLQKDENKDKLIVAILADNGERYLSTDLFDL